MVLALLLATVNPDFSDTELSVGQNGPLFPRWITLPSIVGYSVFHAARLLEAE